MLKHLNQVRADMSFAINRFGGRMLDLRGMTRVAILGGGTAGWLAALYLRKALQPHVEVLLISAPEIPIVGVGEGGILNFITALKQLDIPLFEFMSETNAVHKLGFVYEGWRKNNKDPNDYFYHMFPIIEDTSPIVTMMVNHDIPVSYITDSIHLREKNISQIELTHMLTQQKLKNNFNSSFHFDTYKVGQYLRKIALKRGVIHREGLYKDIQHNTENGLVTALLVNDECIPVDFVIDASGFSRQILGKKMMGEWQSFQESLSLNTAIPFHLKHTQKNPDLVTRSTAMNAGWVWQIPLQERIGAGYVYNSNFISAEQAVDEVEQWLGHAIEPIRTITFEAGFYKEIWKGNVLAIGLASGFVEPLEATSIGQTLQQLRLFMNIIFECQAVVSKSSVDYFNKQNANAWYEIRDFIAMHYDTGREDTPFWKFVSNDLVFSSQYLSLKKCWQHRMPKDIELMCYTMGFTSLFGRYSWITIAQALGIIKADATVADLMAVPVEEQKELISYMQRLKKKLGK